MGIQPASSIPPRGIRAVLNWSLFGLLFLATIIKVSLDFPPSANEVLFRKRLPLDAVAFIKDKQPPGRLFNSYNWGAYLLWELPEYPVFIDGRTDLYNDEVIDEWLQVVRAEEGWQEVLDKWDVRLILLEPGMPVDGMLSFHEWQLLFEDDTAVLYGR
jgi:hypothetical protein